MHRAGGDRLLRACDSVSGEQARSLVSIRSMNLRKVFLLIFGLMASIGQGVSAQSVEGELSLEDCLRLAERAPSVVSSAALDLQASLYGVRQTRADLFPQLHVLNSVVYNSPLTDAAPGIQSYVALNGIREYSTLVDARVDLDTSGRMRARLGRARADRDAASARVRIARNVLKHQVTIAYYQSLLAQHLLAVAEATLRESREFETLTRRLSEQGEAARADLVQASADAASREQVVQQARLEVATAHRVLTSFWTSDVDRPVLLVDELEALPAPEDLPSLAPGGTDAPYRSRPELSLWDAEARSARFAAREARAGLFPQTSLVYQWGLDSNQWALHDHGYALFLNLDIPVFDWFKSRDSARQSMLRAESLEHQKEAAERQYSRAYRDAIARVRSYFEQVSVARTQVRLFEESLRLSRLRYEEGEGTALEVVTTQSRLAGARINYLNALGSYWNAKADLEAAQGR